MTISNVSSSSRAGICTSTTRPTSPYVGQSIYETDTNLVFFWNGSAWGGSFVSTISPALTGTPTVPTATVGTNTTQAASTAFVRSETTTRPNFLVYNSGANPSFTSGGTVPYNTEVYDDLNNFASNVFTVPTGHAGTYLFNVNANAYNIGTSNWRIQIATTPMDAWSGYFPALGSSDAFGSMSLIVKLAVGNTAIVRFYTGTSGTMSAGLSYNSFQGVRIL